MVGHRILRLRRAAKYRCFVFQVFQSARFCVWGYMGSRIPILSTNHKKHETGYSLPTRDGVASADATKDEAMTREEALALYRPIRASVRRILRAAIRVCNQSETRSAGWDRGECPTFGHTLAPHRVQGRHPSRGRA